MTSEQLTVQRKVWVLEIEKALAPHFNFKRFMTDYDDTIIVNYGDTAPGAWRATVKVSSTVGKQNRCTLNGNPFARFDGTRVTQALVEEIKKIENGHRAKQTSERVREQEAAKWLARQERDLAELPEVPGITLNILTSGTRAGDYALTFEAGHPLETVSLKQAKEFFKFLAKDKSKSAI